MTREELLKELKRVNYRRNRTSEEMKFANWRLYSSRRRAEAKGWEFDLDRYWFFDELDKGCALTGWEFSLESGTGEKNAMSPSIDRIDSNKGYTKGNCRLVLTCVNHALGKEGEYFLYMWAKDFVRRMDEREI